MKSTNQKGVLQNVTRGTPIFIFYYFTLDPLGRLESTVATDKISS